MFNDGGAGVAQNVGVHQLKPPSSPPRRPAQQIIDDQRSILSNQNSGTHIGEGLNAKPPTLQDTSRQKLKVGSARIQQQPRHGRGAADGKATVGGSQQQVKRRLGQIAQGKRSQSKPAGTQSSQELGPVAPGSKQPRYTTSAKKDQSGATALRESSDSQLNLQPQRSHQLVGGLPVSSSAALGPEGLSLGMVGVEQESNRLMMRQASQALAQGHQEP